MQSDDDDSEIEQRSVDEMAVEGEWKDCDRVYTAEKAGMSDVDKEFVKKTIYELSKNEQKKQQQLEDRIEQLKCVAGELTDVQIVSLTKAADEKIERLSVGRDLSQTWLCVDMDAFFAAVEELYDPSLKGRPMAVGGISMISTANYEARKYGVRSAMPGFIAMKLCPELILVPHHVDKYKAASYRAREVFRRFDPEFEAGSLDEAYLNITDYCQKNHLDGCEVATTLREMVLQETKLTCSVGIAPNCMLAKVSSDINKPNGQFGVPSDEASILTFMKTLPVRKVPGIGRVTEQTLKAFRVEVGGDLIEHRGMLGALFSDHTMEFLLRTGLGLGRTSRHEHTPEGEIGRKGLSCERTFTKTDDRNKLLGMIKEVCEDVSKHLAKEKLRGRTVTLKLKSHTFEPRTRALSLPFYIAAANELYTHACRMLEAEMEFAPFRLIGIRVSNFQHQDGERQSMITDFFRNKASTSVHRCPHLQETEEVKESIHCDKCGMECCGEQCYQEHSDLHLAEMLQQEENRLPPVEVAVQVSQKKEKKGRLGVRKKRKGNQLTMQECLKKKITK